MYYNEGCSIYTGSIKLCECYIGRLLPTIEPIGPNEITFDKRPDKF